MMRRYFSFFGEVEAEDLPEEMRAIRTLIDLKAREIEESEDDIRDYYREVIYPATLWALKTYATIYGPCGWGADAEHLGQDGSVVDRA